VWAIAFRWYSFTGGDDGIHGIRSPEFLASTANTYYFIYGVVVISMILLYAIHKSAFGMTLMAIRDNPQRCEAIGINVRRHQLLGIVIATFFAGVAGVLFVVVEHSVFPDLLLWVFSLELFIMCLLGGWFTFAGPMVGACLVIGLRTFASMYTDYWTLILGVILILIIFWLPDGLLGYVLKSYRGLAMESTKGASVDARS
jgi:branched-chain amino acid transport system permease protein